MTFKIFNKFMKMYLKLPQKYFITNKKKVRKINQMIDELSEQLLVPKGIY